VNYRAKDMEEENPSIINMKKLKGENNEKSNKLQNHNFS